MPAPSQNNSRRDIALAALSGIAPTPGVSKPDPTVLRQYSIMGRVIEKLCGEKPQVERRLKYSDRRRMMENWCAENIDSIITPDELAEVGGVSYATAMKFINERIDLFLKVERGRYIVRNLRAEK